MDTLERAKRELRQNWEEGLDCPCCGQFVKLYKRPFHSSMARVLIILLNHPDEWVHVENHLVSIGSTIKGVHGKLKYWEMVEPKQNDDNSKASSGYWRLTPYGRSFAKRECNTYKNVYTFKDHVYKRSKDMVSIEEALGKKFNYTELMGWLI